MNHLRKICCLQLLGGAILFTLNACTSITRLPSNSPEITVAPTPTFAQATVTLPPHTSTPTDLPAISAPTPKVELCKALIIATPQIVPTAQVYESKESLEGLYISVGQAGIFIQDSLAEDDSRYTPYCMLFYRVLQFFNDGTVISSLYKSNQANLQYSEILENIESSNVGYYESSDGALSISIYQTGWAFYSDGTVFYDDLTRITYMGRVLEDTLIFDEYTYDGGLYSTEEGYPIDPRERNEYQYTKIEPPN